MKEIHNKIFNKLQKNKLLIPSVKPIEIKPIKEVPFHEAFHFKPTDFTTFYKKKLQTCMAELPNLSSLSETTPQFETVGVLLKNGESFYLTDFETTRQISFEDYDEALYPGKIIICGVKRDSENYDLLRHIYTIKNKEVIINKPKRNEELEIVVLKGPFDEETVKNLENKGDVFIFIGPFCVKGEVVWNGFENLIRVIEEMAMKFNKKVILLPAVEDIPPFVFPQSKIGDYKSERIVFGSNPFEFYVNDFHFCYVNNKELEIIQKKHVFVNEVNNDLIKLNKVMNEIFSNGSCINVFEWGINYAIPEYLMHTGKANIFLTTSNIKTKVFKNNKKRNIINIQKTDSFKIMLFLIKSNEGEIEICNSKELL